MKALVIAAALSSLTVFASCSDTGQRPQPTTEADVQAIQEAADALNKAFMAGEMGAFVDIYADDIVLLPPNRPAMVGKEAALEWAKSFYANFTAEEFATTTEEIVVDKDWAFARVSFTWKLVPKAGGEPVQDTVKGIVLWHRDPDGSWKRARVAWNSDSPPSRD